jgi:hypothetical protein
MLDFKDGRICVHEEDMKRTELGKEVLNRSDGSRWHWATWPEIAKFEITVGIFAEGPDRGRVELKLGSRGTIHVDKEDMKKTELGRELLKHYYPLLSWMTWPRIKAWADSQLARLPICGLS